MSRGTEGALEIVSRLSGGEATESLLVRDPARGLVVLERSYPHDETWNPVSEASLRRALARFAEQQQLVARIGDPAILAVHEVGIAEGRIVAVKEYVEGPTLEAWAETQPVESILGTCITAGRVVAAAHRVGACQLAKAPIFIAADRVPRVHAFGAVSPIGARVEFDAPWNTAPEAFDGPVDALTDQWSFACRTWELVYGVPPVSRDSYAALVEAVRRGERDEPPASDTPPALRTILERALAVERGARFASMHDLLDALQTLR